MAAAAGPGRPGLRSGGPAIPTAKIYQAIHGIAAAAPTAPASTISHFERMFSGVERGLEINLLDDFSLPQFSIQPALVCTDIDMKSIPEDVPDLMELPIERGMTVSRTAKQLERGGIEMNTTSRVIFNPNLFGEVKESYEKSEKISEVPIYFFLISSQGHASIIIYSNGILYSLGLGLAYGSYESAGVASGRASGHGMLSAFTGRPDFVADAHMYSPDFLVKPRGIDKRTGKTYKFRIIDMGLFKRKHIQRIMRIVPADRTNVTIRLKKVGAEEAEFEYFNIDMKITYSFLSSASVAGALGSGFNCVSFAQHVFNTRVNCDRIFSGGIVDPFACRSLAVGRVPDAEGAIADLFKNTMVGYLNDKTLEGSGLYGVLDDGVAGGGRRKTLKRKNRKNHRSRRSRK